MEHIVFDHCYWILSLNLIHGMDVRLRLSEFVVFRANKEVTMD
jgi:hypothetical protein